MGLDKAIEHGKEKRKPYRGNKSIDKSCRNHGGCEWCHENRIHKYRKKVEALKERQEDWSKGGND